MKIFKAYDILFGVNDMWHFISKAQEKRNSSISLQKFFEETENKRKWSLINPGSLLSCAYAYFVFGYENKLLDDFPSAEAEGEFINKFTVTSNTSISMNHRKKANKLKQSLRHSIAHCSYSVEVRTDDGQINNDGDVWYKFEAGEKKDGSDRITMEISLPDFGNIIEAAGAHTMKKLKDNNTEKA